MYMKYKRFLCILMAVIILLPINNIYAKDINDTNKSPEAIKNKKVLSEQEKIEQMEKEIADMLSEENDFRPLAINSLLFTSWEHALIRDAKSAFNTALPSERELLESQIEDEFNKEEINSVREISLGGLLFVSPDRWTLWLNNERITPQTLPEEIMDIKVHKEYIELLWHDKKDNLLYPIRLRPHQRFNLDVRMFLPG